MTIFLNVGNLFTDSYLDKVIELDSAKGPIHIRSLYGSLAYMTPTARSFDRLPTKDQVLLERYVNRAHQAGVAIRWTLNQSCIGSLQQFSHVWEENGLKATILSLYNMGIWQWTVTSPLLVELIQDLCPNPFIEVSTICEVSSIQELETWAELGIAAVNLSTKINRNFDTLKSLQTYAENLGIRLSLLTNEACLYACPWRRECYNLSSHNSSRAPELFGMYPFSRCNAIRLEDPVEWLRSRMILPQWVETYVKHTGINHFKVAFRTHPEEVAIPILQAYMQKHWGGNLLDLWPSIAELAGTEEPKEQTFIPCAGLDRLGFLEHFISNQCGGCSECDYCTSVYRKLAGKQLAMGI